MSFSVIEGQYFRDILDQPRALRQTIAGLTADAAIIRLADGLRRRDFDRIVLTGMGCSYFALHPLCLALGHSGYLPIMVETSELLHQHSYLLTSRTLVIVVSQSGRSAEIVRLVERNREGTIAAVTNSADSPLATASEVVILTNAGEEFSVSCKTYVSTLVALHWLASILTGRDSNATRGELEAVVPAVDDYLSQWKLYVTSVANRLKNIEHMFLVGRGSSLATVGTGALTIKESDHFHAEGMSSAAFRHGPFEMLNEKVFVFVFSGDGQSRELNLGLLRDVKKLGSGCAWVAEDATEAELRLPTVAPGLRPVVEILPMQMVTLALAANDNREAGRFVHSTKVTTVE